MNVPAYSKEHFQPLDVGALLDDYAGRLYQVATFLFNDEDAAMLVEQSFLSVIERVRALPPDKAGRELLRELGRRSAALYRSRYGDSVLRDERPAASDLTWLDPFSLTDWSEKSTELLGGDRLQELLRRVLQQLRPSERLLFVLHDVVGLPDEEICGWLELEKNVVREFLQAARLKIRDRLNAEFQAAR